MCKPFIANIGFQPKPQGPRPEAQGPRPKAQDQKSKAQSPPTPIQQKLARVKLAEDDATTLRVICFHIRREWYKQHFDGFNAKNLTQFRRAVVISPWLAPFCRPILYYVTYVHSVA